MGPSLWSFFLVQQNTYKSVKFTLSIKQLKKISKTLIVRLSFLTHQILERNLKCIFPWDPKWEKLMKIKTHRRDTTEQLRQGWDERAMGCEPQEGAQRCTGSAWTRIQIPKWQVTNAHREGSHTAEISFLASFDFYVATGMLRSSQKSRFRNLNFFYPIQILNKKVPSYGNIDQW